MSPRRTVLAAALEQARALAATLEAELELLEAEGARLDGDEVIGVKVTQAEYRVGRATLLRGERDEELLLMRGARGALLVKRRDLELYLARRAGRRCARPSSATKRTAVPPPAANDHDAKVAKSLELALGGRR